MIGNACDQSVSSNIFFPSGVLKTMWAPGVVPLKNFEISTCVLNRWLVIGEVAVNRHDEAIDRYTSARAV